MVSYTLEDEMYEKFFSLHYNLLCFMANKNVKRRPVAYAEGPELKRKSGISSRLESRKTPQGPIYKVSTFDNWCRNKMNFLVILLIKKYDIEVVRELIVNDVGEEYFFTYSDDDIFDALDEKGYLFDWNSLYGPSRGDCNPSILRKLLSKGVLEQGIPDNYRNIRTPSFEGFASGNEEVFNAYISRGISLMEKDEDGNTVLDHCIKKKNGSTTYIKKLVDNGVDVTSINVEGNSVLFHAIIAGYDVDVIQLLVEAGADVNHVNKNGCHILYLLEDWNPHHIGSERVSRRIISLEDYLISVGAEDACKKE
jgi:hypothetical protein